MNDKKNPKKSIGVAHVLVSKEEEGQRIDNFLLARFKGMPKSRIYRMIRKGEVRVNKKRIAASYRIVADDDLRLPPVKLDQEAKKLMSEDKELKYEDAVFMAEANLKKNK